MILFPVPIARGSISRGPPHCGHRAEAGERTSESPWAGPHEAGGWLLRGASVVAELPSAAHPHAGALRRGERPSGFLPHHQWLRRMQEDAMQETES